jgi:hypothetical protein
VAHEICITIRLRGAGRGASTVENRKKRGLQCCKKVKRRQVYDSLKASVHVSYSSKDIWAGWLRAYRYAQAKYNMVSAFPQGGMVGETAGPIVKKLQ